MTQIRLRNLRVLAALCLVIGGMVTLVSYSVTLYRLFCEATGFGGTTQRAAGDDAVVSDRMVTVRFSTDIAGDLPWRFQPAQKAVRVRLGAETLVFFAAQNLSDKPLVGHATFNVTPTKAGIYFNKIQCFCFAEQRLEAGESVEMPVDFFVSPDLARDETAREVETITLSYTFFPSRSPEKGQEPDSAAQADPARGRAVFAGSCVACHALDRNKAGPLLGGVVGRAAGAVPGYAYSPALRGAALAWSPDRLDAWLRDPRALLPGTRMPIRVPDAAARRDLIAYLQAVGAAAAAGGGRAPAPPPPPQPKS